MRRLPSPLALLVLLTASNFIQATDLASIDRTIRKEPVYQGHPKYCLLVFGPEAKTRVWLVQDGNALYVDRNGNGDLTEPDEKVAAQKAEEPAEEGVYQFKCGDIHAGELTHKDLTLDTVKLDFLAESDAEVKAFITKNPKARGCTIRVATQFPGRTGNGIDGRVQQTVWYNDLNGVFQFADLPTQAPVAHLGGPFHITFWDRPTLRVGRNNEILLGVGTPGIGSGSFAYIAYEAVIPKDAFPKVEVTFSPMSVGDTPVKELYELKHRC